MSKSINAGSEKASAVDANDTEIAKRSDVHEGAAAHGQYAVSVTGPREFLRGAYVALRNLNETLNIAGWFMTASFVAFIMQMMTVNKWNDLIKNVVTIEGKNKALDEFLAGSAYTAVWYMGLQNGAAATDASTYAVPICTEVTDYTEGTRPAPAFAAASGGSKATSSAVAFSINATVTVDGVMLSDLNTKGNTAGGGVLYSAGDFSGGSKAVANGDTLNVTYTASL